MWKSEQMANAMLIWFTANFQNADFDVVRYFSDYKWNKSIYLRLQHELKLSTLLCCGRKWREKPIVGPDTIAISLFTYIW